MDRKGFNTRAVGGGELKLGTVGNVVTPIFQSTTYAAPNRSDSPEIDNSSGKPYNYSRGGNPTVQAFEEKYAGLEGVERGAAFSSGMGAISSVILSLATGSRKVLSLNEIYGQTYNLLNYTLRNLGINARFLGLSEFNGLEFDPSGHDAVYLESMVNPTMGVPDLQSIAKRCMEADVPLVVDATFATPFNQRPSEFGASVVIHSVTKYIGGHSDLVMGISGSDKERYGSISSYRKSMGAIADPFPSFLAMRGLKTLGLRMEKHNRNGMEVARFLEEHHRILKVNYPGLVSFEYHESAVKNLTGYGGMMSFEVSGGLESARKLMKNLTIPEPAPSLGGVESLISIPAESSHVTLTPEERRRAGIGEGLVRLSVGIEDHEDIIEDFKNALEKS
ncbi:MAG: PLP-dependent transferase [Candidatus Thermoplasmatota archaeon]|nr:PLP-dependent transferase [Candidatus Thermoplasmatota archaeon]